MLDSLAVTAGDFSWDGRSDGDGRDRVGFDDLLLNASMPKVLLLGAAIVITGCGSGETIAVAVFNPSISH